jgi:serine/threonine-protein kinase HipA
LTTNISLDEATCDLNLVISVAEFFSIATDEAKTIVKEVVSATVTWREVATDFGATRAQIRRMSSAFEHDDLARALELCVGLRPSCGGRVAAGG